MDLPGNRNLNCNVLACHGNKPVIISNFTVAQSHVKIFSRKVFFIDEKPENLTFLNQVPLYKVQLKTIICLQNIFFLKYIIISRNQ